MDTQRLILLTIFAFSLFLLVEAWQQETRGTAKPQETAASTAKPPAEAPPVPSAKLEPPGAPVGGAPAPTSAGAAELISVTTDFLRAEIDPVGGTVTRVELLKHKGTLDKNKVFVLLQRVADHTYVAQSGLIGEGLPNHTTRYTASAREFRLADGQDKLEVRLEANGTNGAPTSKTLTFSRGSYAIEIRHEFRNTGAAPLKPYAYYQLVRDGKAPDGDSAMLPTYTGAAVYTEQQKFQKVSFDDIGKGKAPYPKTAEEGWIGLVQHYFVAAWIAPEKTVREFYTKRLDTNLYAAGLILPLGAVEPGATGVQQVTLYAGPQEQDKLAKLAPGLDLVVDYGWLTVIAAPLFWVLERMHGWVGNWGIAIILLTCVIKLIFYPLSAASYKSMAKMRVLAPKLQQLKERYGDDRQRMHQAMMELYKTEKINPLGGCLPIVVQIPVFIALYWVLLASVELRQAPFMLWIDDLSSPDPFYILPVLMGATMIIQTRLNPVPPDPIQAKIMKIMPIAFSVFFFFFPAGLVLYWLVNNILSIAQQWQITRALEQQAAAAAAHGRR